MPTSMDSGPGNMAQKRSIIRANEAIYEFDAEYRELLGKDYIAFITKIDDFFKDYSTITDKGEN